MNLYELGKNVKSLRLIAEAIDEKLTQAVATSADGRVGETVRPFTTNFPCVPSREVVNDFGFTTTLSAFTIISNTARGDDYVVATVSSEEVLDSKLDQNGDPISFGSSIYLVRSNLQSMVELATHLNEAVSLCYGVYNYRAQPDPPGDIPIIFGVRASWTPTSGDFNNVGEGLLVSLEARLNSSCALRIRARFQTTFNGPITEFRAGDVATQQKLDALAAAYYRARVQRRGFNALSLDGDVLERMQLQ